MLSCIFLYVGAKYMLKELYLSHGNPSSIISIYTKLFNKFIQNYKNIFIREAIVYKVGRNEQREEKKNGSQTLVV